MIEAKTQVTPVVHRTRLSTAWLRTGELLESEQTGRLLAATGLVVLALSATAALVSAPASAGAILLTASAAAFSLVVALGVSLRSGWGSSAGRLRT